MTGAGFPIVEESQADGEAVIGIGRTKRLASAGMADATGLGDEGYGIGVKGKELYLFGGRKRGPINAVYALLEEDLGCRWYAGKSSQIPHAPTLVFRPVPRTFAPALTIRDPFYRAAFNGTWSLRKPHELPQCGRARRVGRSR